jgi:ribosomal protein S18 acetylase RimI-like enzyme
MFQFSEIKKPSEIPVFPSGLSFFDPYLEYYIREAFGIGGEVQIATDSNKILGLFIYDSYEKTGSIYTHSMEVFDYFCKLKPSSFLFAEIDTNKFVREVFNIHMLSLEGELSHTFKYEVSPPKLNEIERFMLFTHPSVNPLWPRVALNNGDKCFVVKLDRKYVGCGWVSLVNGIGRLHTLYVNSQYRRIGIATDLLYARLLWLKLKGARSVFSEISENNIAASSVARKAQMVPCSRMYMYMT